MLRNILMIDIETTGTKPGCKVLSIGAFGFNQDGNQVEFYARINHTKMEKLGLFDEPSTIDWWNRQDENTKAEAFGGTENPALVAAGFKTFFYQNFDSASKILKFSVWSCGIDFDFPILQEFFRILGMSLPWKFWQQNDYRTIRNQFNIKAHEGNVEKHNAIEDAKAQMRGLRYFFNEVKTKIK